MSKIERHKLTIGLQPQTVETLRAAASEHEIVSKAGGPQHGQGNISLLLELLVDDQEWFTAIVGEAKEAAIQRYTKDRQ